MIHAAEVEAFKCLTGALNNKLCEPTLEAEHDDVVRVEYEHQTGLESE